jgi:hypothetical protein
MVWKGMKFHPFFLYLLSEVKSGSAVKARYSWLGKDYRTITNGAGDNVFMSKDGLRKIRFDINKTSPHANPHTHVEEFVNGKWVKSGPLYPKDMPRY